MNIPKNTAYKKYHSDYGALEIQPLKGDTSALIPVEDNYLNLSHTRSIDSFLAACILSARDNMPLLYTRVDMQQVVSLSIQHDSLQRNLTNRMHRHEFFALSIIASGNVEMQIETQRITCHPGDVVIVNRNTRHAEDLLRNATLYDIELTKDYLLQASPTDEKSASMSKTLDQFFTRNLESESKRNRNFIQCAYLGDASHIEISDIFLRISAELEEKRPGFQLVIRALTYRLFAMLSDPALYSCTYVDLGFDGGESLAITAKHFLDKTKRKISRTELSEHLHYSSTHINRVFQKYFGESVKDYNRKIYMRETAKLLTSTNMNIQEIIRAIGFDNRTHFYKLFYESYQMTPAEYRDRHASHGKV